MLLSGLLALGLSARAQRAQTAAAVAPAIKVEKVVVHKQQRRMELFHKGVVWKSYRIALGGDPVGHKM